MTCTGGFLGVWGAIITCKGGLLGVRDAIITCTGGAGCYITCKLPAQVCGML